MLARRRAEHDCSSSEGEVEDYLEVLKKLRGRLDQVSPRSSTPKLRSTNDPRRGAQGHGDGDARACGCSGARRRGPASLSRPRLSRGSRNINTFGDHDGGALVPRHDDALPERRRQRAHLGMGHTLQWNMFTRADYHGALWKESLREIFRMTSDGYCTSRPTASWNEASC